MPDLPTSTHLIEFPYTRTLGPVFGPFLTGLRDGHVLGIRSNDGRVLVPPTEWDPETGMALDPSGLVPVGPGGVVETWAWVTEPTPKHPLPHPFAFALVRLDGADTALMHAVDAGSIDAMATGMRVTARFADERVGRITDLVFVPETGASVSETGASVSETGASVSETGASVSEAGIPPSSERPMEAGIPPSSERPMETGASVSEAGTPPSSERPMLMDYFMHLEYEEVVCPIVRRYADALMAGKLLGQVSPASGLVYVPPRSYDPVACEWLGEEHLVELEDRGVVTNFTIVTPVQYYGQEETEPFAKASVLLDGPGGMLSLQDILEIPPDEVRVGLRVEAVWLPEGERDTDEIGNRSWGSAAGAIAGWRPTGEPDLPAESFLDKVY